MTTVVPVEGALLGRMVTGTPECSNGRMSPGASAKFDAALAKTPWALQHRRRFALVEGDEILARAERYHLSGVLDGQLVTICGIAGVCGGEADDARNHGRALVEHLVESAEGTDMDLALLFQDAGAAPPAIEGFEGVPTLETELSVSEPSRHGAPMTLVRSGEDRDLDAIAAMGRVRATPFRFHLARDSSFVKHAITRGRLLAGLVPAGVRQLEFVIAEEGITAAAYLVISVVGDTWTIEECGDRDASGARVGALLQALIAREPGESRPRIRGWLPPGFLPPQVRLLSTSPSRPALFVRALSPRVRGLALSVADVMYWHNDLLS